MQTYRRLDTATFWLGLAGVVVGGLACAILGMTGEWDLGKFLGRFQRGLIVGFVLAVMFIFIEWYRLAVWDEDGELRDFRFARLPAGATVETTEATGFRMASACVVVTALAWGVGALEVAAWPLGGGVALFGAHKALTDWQRARRITIYQERRIWRSRNRPEYFTKPLKPA